VFGEIDVASIDMDVGVVRDAHRARHLFDSCGPLPANSLSRPLRGLGRCFLGHGCSNDITRRAREVNTDVTSFHFLR